MERSAVGRNLAEVRETRMWTQVRLAREAGVSPTTISGIESGRISRPHFGTLRKLAAALGVEPERLLSSSGAGRDELPSRLSLEWSMSSGDEEFERGLEGASIEGLNSLSGELDEEESRLRRLYGEARGSEQRRLIKSMIRQVAANSGSVEATLAAHEDNLQERPSDGRSSRDGRRGAQEPQPEHP
jgi:transcriptional regulator with XRE-family HTH domain